MATTSANTTLAVSVRACGPGVVLGAVHVGTARAMVCTVRVLAASLCLVNAGRSSQELPSSLSVLPEYLQHLRSLPPMPRRIHYSWQDPARLLNSSTELVRRGVRAAIATNPRWDVRIYDDAEMDRIIRSSSLVSAADWAILKREHPVAKVDLLRLIVMYEQGGLYSDVDRLFNKDLDQLLGSHTRLLLPTHFDVDFSQDLMASSPGNRLFKEAVELNLARRRSMRHNARGAISGDDLLHLGPISYSHAVLTAIFGVRVDRPAMGRAMPRIRAALGHTDGLIAAPRETKCHTAVYAGPDRVGSCAKWLDKTALHAEFRRKAWTDEISSAWSQEKTLPRAGSDHGGGTRARGRGKGRGRAARGANRRRGRGARSIAAAATPTGEVGTLTKAATLAMAVGTTWGPPVGAATFTMELPLLYAVDSIQSGRDAHERRRPWYRVRLAGPALLVAPVRRLHAAVCRSDATPAEVYPLLRNSSVAGMRAGVPWCVGHVAELSVPVAGRYFVEAVTLVDDFNLERYEQHCSALRHGAPPLLTATVALDRSNAAPPLLGGGGAYLLDPAAATAAATATGAGAGAGATQPRAVRTRVQDVARCPASKASLALDARDASQHAPGYRWAAVDTAGAWEARAAPLPPGTCVVGDSQGRNLCLPVRAELTLTLKLTLTLTLIPTLTPTPTRASTLTPTRAAPAMRPSVRRSYGRRATRAASFAPTIRRRQSAARGRAPGPTGPESPGSRSTAAVTCYSPSGSGRCASAAATGGRYSSSSATSAMLWRASPPRCARAAQPPCGCSRPSRSRQVAW